MRVKKQDEHAGDVSINSEFKHNQVCTVRWLSDVIKNEYNIAQYKKIQNGDRLTGSTYSLGCGQASDSNPTAKPRFSRMHSQAGTLLDTEICTRSTEINISMSKPEVLISSAEI